MPPKKRSGQKGGGRGHRGKGSAKAGEDGKKVPTADDYYQKGVNALTQLEPELAISFLQRALDIDPENVIYMDVYSEACIQLGDSREALATLTKATSTSDDSYYRWLTLAQLQQGIDALLSFERGITLMKSKLQDKSTLDEREAKKLHAQISQAYASIADLYMTDLCFEEEAEILCEECIKSAIQYDPMGLDGHQSMANLRLSQKRDSEACTIIWEVYNRTMELRKKHQERGIIQELLRSSNNGVNGNCDNSSASGDDSDVPSTQFSVQTAKLLIECSNNESNDFPSSAICLLTDLLNDDDENIEIWYIIGVAALESNPPDYDLARYNLEKAQEMMNVVYQQIGSENFPFTDEMLLVQEHLKLINENHFPDANMTTGIRLTVNSEVDEEDEEWSTEEEIEVDDS